MKLEQQMFDLIEQQRDGAMQVGDFCQQHGITYAKFYYWRRRWQARRASSDLTSSGQLVPTGFVELQPTDPVSGLCLDLADGSRLRGTAKQLAAFYHQLHLLDHA